MTDKGVVYLDDLVDKYASVGKPCDIDPLELLGKYIMSDEEMEKISDSEFIIDGFIVSGQLHMICAAPNAGKTTILFHLAGEMVQKGYQVIYVHADTSAGNAKEFHREAKEMGITLLLPDMKVGKSMTDVVGDLRQINSSGADLSNHVFIFDTYKKMADVISKSANKDMLILLRGLTAKGATIICLAHTNKYDDKDGMPIYEGTGDIRSDVDNLIYLIPAKNPDSSITVSVVPDKERAPLKKMTFKISPDREVTLAENYEDVLARKIREERYANDQDVIERIVEVMQKGKFKQCDIIEYCQEHKIGKRRARDCLNRYRHEPGMIWRYERSAKNNAIYYYLC